MHRKGVLRSKYYLNFYFNFYFYSFFYSDHIFVSNAWFFALFGIERQTIKKFKTAVPILDLQLGFFVYPSLANATVEIRKVSSHLRSCSSDFW